jgi:hypothetical protein
MKTGRLSKDEWAMIEELADTHAPEDIAKKLNRDLDPILKYLQKIGKADNRIQSLVVQAEYDLRSRPYWKELKSQFSESELELFLYHWSEIVAQFRKDVLKTEELQIVDLIKLEILMNRALREQQESKMRIEELEQDLNRLKTVISDQQDREEIFSIERQIASMRAAKEALSREYKDLYSKKESSFKNLKATREQRIQKLESSKVTLSGLIEKILRDPDFFEEQGKYLEKMRLAMEVEKKRLSDYHKYGDGEVDQPFLNADTIIN